MREGDAPESDLTCKMSRRLRPTVADELIVPVPVGEGLFLCHHESSQEMNQTEASYDTLPNGTFPLLGGGRFFHHCPG